MILQEMRARTYLIMVAVKLTNQWYSITFQNNNIAKL